MAKHLKILVVDDFATMRRIIRNLLKEIGYEDIEEAEDGQQAFNKLKLMTFDFVVTDINMHHMNGFQLLAAIKKDRIVRAVAVGVVAR